MHRLWRCIFFYNMETVLVKNDGPVQIIQINRPEVRNAVDGTTAGALANAFRAFEADDTAKVAVLCGAEGTFCAGADLKAVSGEGSAHRMEPDGDAPMGPSRMFLSKPTIAAVQGYAVAGGLELALLCDLRVMEESAIMGVFCRRWGVPLVDGGTIRLPRLIGLSRAMDLILTGRPVSAQEAHQMGLANRICVDGEAINVAIELAKEIARFPQNCMRSDRQSAYEQFDLDMKAALVNEFKLGMQTVQSQETVQGAKRFASGKGRHGNFKDI